MVRTCADSAVNMSTAFTNSTNGHDIFRHYTKVRDVRKDIPRNSKSDRFDSNLL